YDWTSKITSLLCISETLLQMHDLGLLHCDLHSGNILQSIFTLYEFSMERPFITDFGLSKAINETMKKECGDMVGVLPYIAPEVLLGNQYTDKSEIYSFGILMSEFSTGKLPFCNMELGSTFVIQICYENLRPEFAEGTPKPYIDLAMKCLDRDPLKRPNIREVHDYFKKWQMVTLKKCMPSEYFSPVINDYVTFNAEEFEENKNLFLEFVKSDEINTNAKPYNKQGKKNYMIKLMNFKDVL
ncbi:26095_t:CDS:1, partial [Gigaspora margarita]